eukprot:gb/GECG01005227.1/.p1 GENE.gb/GECG01005227.1/~~gb/GECG01005227.1/.p1  ORF type:complete len:659 (+),score=69.35 gb/GECG01005227.1/:1-1977(+)
MRANCPRQRHTQLSATAGLLSWGLCAWIVLPYALADDHVQVDTVYGPVKGNVKNGVNVFNSIPFAKPPTGERRFKPPEPPEAWEDPVDAWKLSWVCPQIKILGGIFLGNEDCLYLHLWAPANATKESKLPVMFWIFGGGYVLGDGDEFGFYDGTHLANKHNVIVVAPNYRLNSLGFLALPELKNESEHGSTGNLALFDQRLAMKWVQQNINEFGGDPARVAIFGESAGGFSVCWHLGSPASSGLFHAAIMESGTCDAPQFFQSYSYATSFGEKFAESVGCKEAGPSRLQCLRSLSTEHLMKSVFLMLDPNWPNVLVDKANAVPSVDVTLRGALAERAIESGYHQGESSSDQGIQLQGIAMDEYLELVFGLRAGDFLGKTNHRNLGSRIPLPALSPAMAFGPCVDGTEVALPARPLEMFQKGKFNDVPTIFGTNKDEGSIFAPFVPIIKKGAWFPSGTHSIKLAMKKFFNMYKNASLVDEAVDELVKEYPKKDYEWNDWGRVADIITDYFFTCANRRAVRAVVLNGSPKNGHYLYEFNQKLQWIESWIFGHGLLGNYHTSELDMVFDNQWPPILHSFNKNEKKLSARMMQYWTNMARFASPNQDAETMWPKYTFGNGSNDEDQHYMNLRIPLKPDRGLRQKKCDFWDSIVAKLQSGGEY